MIFLTHQEKLKFQELEQENKRIKIEMERKTKENSILNSNLKAQIQLSNDLDQGDFRQKYETTSKLLNSLMSINKDQNEEIDALKKKVLDLESKLGMQSVIMKKDSSNSSKPSGTNGFKKVITNRRQKSSKKQGGQKGHSGCTINKINLEEIKNDKNTVIEYIEINKTDSNQHMKPIIRTIEDIEIIRKVKVIKIYPNENGKYDIPKEFSVATQYGSNLKAMCVELLVANNNSTDAVKRFVRSITNFKINLSKATLINWLEVLCKKLKPQVVKIQEELNNAYYLNHDESQIKISGKTSNVICASNQYYTRLWISEKKSKKAIDDINFLPYYNGIIVKDGTSLYNQYGKCRSQCVSHILRYLKGIYDFNSHKGPKNMSNFLSKCIEERDKYIDKGIDSFNENEYTIYINEFYEILKEWIKEWKHSDSENNLVYDDERKLLQRFENEIQRSEILYFLKNFKVPATNNQAESDLRPIKIKQKIGKFRSEKGAVLYAIIRSCINTYKKQGYNSFNMFKKAFEHKLEII